jgi:hypothetical protein
MRSLSEWLFFMFHQEELKELQNYARQQYDSVELISDTQERGARADKFIGIAHVARLLRVPKWVLNFK